MAPPPLADLGRMEGRAAVARRRWRGQEAPSPEDLPVPTGGRGEREVAENYGAGDFPTTHWSLVLAAGEASAPAACQALADLCQSYWFPLYAYIRRRGHDPERARELTQDLFVRLL